MIAGDENCAIHPPEAVPHAYEPGDCTFQHDLCEWTIWDENTFYWNHTNGQYLNDAGIAGPDTDHFGDPHGI